MAYQSIDWEGYQGDGEKRSAWSKLYNWILFNGKLSIPHDYFCY